MNFFGHSSCGMAIYSVKELLWGKKKEKDISLFELYFGWSRKIKFKREKVLKRYFFYWIVSLVK